MNNIKSIPLKLTLFASIVSPIFTLFVASWVFTSALSGINPENHDKVLIHPVSQDTVDIIWALTLMVIPIEVALIIVAAINFKFKKRIINVAVLSACVLLFLWTIFAGWAMHSEFVDKDSYVNSSEQTENGKLQIRSLNLE